ncbi:LysR family transcriptional regulator [Comamonas serinivorans]|uniref:LysR family transcriptional regulator n=1 Tax=Comamonas serinivorans TaxID=1082851 RepID=A0A1Y0EP39_9BURK|nr:LysR substrate-binding domain-containing protein [Comamonas serinivorans]ARU05403.1 LysR family transcriptional regulator [Comamonas serinivorans]
MQHTHLSTSRALDLTTLRLFVAVAETGSIGQAAEREFMAASAISKRLSDLEHLLRAPLLDRHARGVTLTPAGDALLHHARNVLFGIDKLQAELSEYADGIRGHVRVHASMSAIFEFLPEDLGAFIHRHPEVKIDLQEHLSAEVARAVLEGAADLGICNLSGATRELQTLPYRRDRLVLVAPQRHRLAKREALALAEALDEDFVGLTSGSSIALALQRAASNVGKTVRLRIQVAGLDAMCRMIHAGLGVGVMPERAFALMQGVGELASVPLTDDWAVRDIGLVARDFGSLPMTARTLVAHLRERSGAQLS